MTIDDTDLLAYVDGDLAPERRAEIEAAVAATPKLAARLAAMRASVLPYAAAFESQALPPVPDHLTRRVADLARSPRPERSPWHWARMGAAFAAGVLSCAIALKLLLPGVAPISSATPLPPWITAVAEYQQLYSRATLAHVSEDPQLSARIISELRTEDGMQIAVPDLRSAGLSFKRVQRLSLHDSPVVQMVYLPEHGEPIALCATPDARPDESPHAQQVGEMNAVAWRRGNVGYVLLGRESAQELMDLGRQIASGNQSRLYGRNGRASPPTTA
jgi:anti-sigma factor RsiW